jgi:hypothetical protein
MPWETISADSEILDIHAALLPTGTRCKIIYFGQSKLVGFEEQTP